MTIICKLQGGFGNHLLNVLLGIIYYEHLNMPIYLEGNHIRNDVLHLRNDTRTTIYKVINPTIVTSHIEHSPNTIVINSFSSYLAILENIHSYKLYNIYINIIGADKMSFYTKYIDIIKKYIIIPPVSEFPLKNKIIVSLRLGMGAHEVSKPSPYESDLRLPFIYYKTVIDSLIKDNTEIYICSDNFTDTYITRFLTEYSGRIYLMSDKDTLFQAGLIAYGDHVISSNSTFALVVGMLNSTGIIYVPEFKSSGAAFPDKSNSCYRDILYSFLPNIKYVPIDG